MEQIDAVEFEFDEAWYLSANTDIARAVAKGTIPSGLAHYLRHGIKEGRLPHPPYNAEERSLIQRHKNENYLAPTDLTTTQTQLNRVAFIGSCQMECWRFDENNPSKTKIDSIIVNNLERLPRTLSDGIQPSEYDFQLIQLPLRFIVHDDCLARLSSNSKQQVEEEFEASTIRMESQVRSWMEWNDKYGLLTFVANFFVPQMNSLGRLFPKYSLQNPEYYIYRLNEELEKLVRSYNNAYIVDVDRISSSLGKRLCQDDNIFHSAHGAMMPTNGPRYNRILPLGPVHDYYNVTWPTAFTSALWAELLAMYRTVRQIDAVKLVVVDLDDTLWEGVSGDADSIDTINTEGWPLGVAEALLFLKKRGILIAIISKNDEARIRKIWPEIYGSKITLEDFAEVKINWQSKSENMADILSAMNILPKNVVFVDDNPVERAAIAGSFPDMRIIGSNPYYVRRILLWSSETQSSTITEESSNRTEMMRAQIRREAVRAVMSREDLLSQAAPRMTPMHISSVEHPRFQRAFELINKTNQYNTNGK